MHSLIELLKKALQSVGIAVGRCHASGNVHPLTPGRGFPSHCKVYSLQAGGILDKTDSNYFC